jgi:hypothetical protein
MKSIIQNKKECFFCGNPNCYDHHIYFGSNRKVSERHGFKVWLCLDHHTAGKHSPHQNRETDLYLKKICQEKFEETGTREDFIKLIGRNYL